MYSLLLYWARRPELKACYGGHVMSEAAKSPASIISAPTGGGAVHGIGEKFAPDLHTGTGNFTIPIALPAGRNGLQPSLNLVYSTGHGNGLFGLGWSLDVPGVSRKVANGVPRYSDEDVFVLSGAEDLVHIAGAYPEHVTYRPRTEGLFARIEHVADGQQDHWEVRSKDGLISWYGTSRPIAGREDWMDPATIRVPETDARHVYAWKLTRTQDPFGNLIEYRYNERDAGSDGPHQWDQPLLTEIAYADYGPADDVRFLITVRFEYEERPDVFSEYRAGFEIRTTRRCRRIVIESHAEGAVLPARHYDFEYAERPENGISLLSRIAVCGYSDDGQSIQELPALQVAYTGFEPTAHRLAALTGPDLPVSSLASPDMELVDLFGSGLPDILLMNGTVRYWRNLGKGRFDSSQSMRDAPGGLALADPGVQLIDADGDARADLLVTRPGLAGYFPLRFGGAWDRRSFQRYGQAPSFNLDDPDVRLVDLDGDGVTDAVRCGASLECFFNHPTKGWHATRRLPRSALEGFPHVTFSDPRVKWADMTGDGLQDIVLIHDGNIDYWPNLGYGRWGKRIPMRHSPDLPHRYDPARLLVGDVDGDGLADLVYVENGQVRLWLNQSGNGWSEQPITIRGTPPVTNIDAVRLVDLHGVGASGLLWTTDATAARKNMWFLDFTGGVKPYLLETLDNQLGAVTRIQYAPSTHFFAEDQRHPETRWRTPLPFPVHVVARVEIVDEISGGKLTTEYRYRHGYWDGAEREFHGFGMVEQRDTESFDDYRGDMQSQSAGVASQHFSPPTLTKTWFHQGAVGDHFGDWKETDFGREYWSGDGQLLEHTDGINTFLSSFAPTPHARSVKREALCALRGSVLRTELYALDGSQRQSRPYTVTEHAYGLAKVVLRDDNTRLEHYPQAADLASHADDERPQHVFFPYPRAVRTTQWERGDDPMTRFSFTDGYDEFGQPCRQTEVACPRGWRAIGDTSSAYLATRTRTVYARPIDLQQTYIGNRQARSATFEIRPTTAQTVTELAALADDATELSLIGQTLHFYDGDPFTGLPNGQVGGYGALMRTEALVFTEDIVQNAYGTRRPPYLASTDDPAWTADYPQAFQQGLPTRAGYIHQPGDAIYAAGYYATAERRRYDFQTAGQPTRGLVTVLRPPLGTSDGRYDSHIVYDDPYHLLPIQATDPLNLSVRCEYDYQHFKPRRITDSNGTSSRFTYTPMGLLAASKITGKAPGEGDQAQPGVVMRYALRAFEEHRQPAYAHTIRRENHDGATAIETREYSDGFGRVLQTRLQAEDVIFGEDCFGSTIEPSPQPPLPQRIVGRIRPGAAPPNVVVKGWQIYDNKGRVVERYEPFFDVGWEYARPGNEQHGAKATLSFDPRGQVIRTVGADGSEERILFGEPRSLDAPDTYEPTPWVVYTYDANDNAGRTHATTSQRYADHHNTPSHVVIDALGRTVTAVERNRNPLGFLDEHATRMTYDIRGNLLTVADALDRPTFTQSYDLAGRRLRLDNIDAGQRWTVFDAAGQVTEQCDGKGAHTLHVYDVAGRPTLMWGRDISSGKTTLRERLDYGDGSRHDQLVGEREANRNANRLGRLHRHWDEAGLIVVEAYDFKGNVSVRRRQVINDAALAAGWTAAWDEANAEDAVDTTVYVSDFAYDALNRTTLVRYPQDVTGVRRELRPVYNRAGALESVSLDGALYVRHMAYDAKGQCTLIVYGNNVLTANAYDDETFRLRRQWTGHYVTPPGTAHTYHPVDASEVLQDCTYSNDLVGNILELTDRTPACGVGPSPNKHDRSFTYDALYRLRTASGRECNALTPPRPWDVSARCQDLSRSRAYVQTYSYDRVGNIVKIQHSPANDTTPAREFTIVPGSNRLQHVLLGATRFAYDYDANGNVTSETTSRHFTWDHGDRLTGFRIQAVGGPVSLRAVYLYDGAGQRVKKLVRDQGGRIRSTVYIDGVFEHHVRGADENNTLHVTDDRKRVAQVRIGAAFSDDGASDSPVQYHLADHLGSSSVVIGGETSADSALVSREEYTPYGETSFGSYAHKRYRYRGKERDEESGLSYFGFRYYLPWLGRWASPDPIGRAGGLNLYRFVRSNPINRVDPVGLADEDSTEAARRGATGPTYNEQFMNPGAPQYARMTEGTISINGDDVKPAPATISTAGGVQPTATSTPGNQQRRPSIAQLRQERLEAALSGMKDEVIDMATGLVDMMAGTNPVTSALVDATLGAFKDNAPPVTNDKIRDLELQESYEGGKTVVTAISIAASLVPTGEIVQGSNLMLSKLGVGPRTHITYVFKDAPNSIRYVGRASGVGSPEKVLYDRLLKGHHVFLEHESLYAEVLAEHSSRSAAMGGESVYHDYFEATGHKLLNDTPPLSTRLDKLLKTQKRIADFFADWPAGQFKQTVGTGPYR